MDTLTSTTRYIVQRERSAMDEMYGIETNKSMCGSVLGLTTTETRNSARNLTNAGFETYQNQEKILKIITSRIHNLDLTKKSRDYEIIICNYILAA